LVADPGFEPGLEDF